MGPTSVFGYCPYSGISFFSLLAIFPSFISVLDLKISAPYPCIPRLDPVTPAVLTNPLLTIVVEQQTSAGLIFSINQLYKRGGRLK